MAKELAEVEAAVAELNAITATKQEEDIYDTGLFDSLCMKLLRDKYDNQRRI